MMQNKICDEIIPILFENPHQVVLREDTALTPAYINAFLSAEPAECSEYCLNTTTWD